jgi:hypothetical protein
MWRGKMAIICFQTHQLRFADVSHNPIAASHPRALPARDPASPKTLRTVDGDENRSTARKLPYYMTQQVWDLMPDKPGSLGKHLGERFIELWLGDELLHRRDSILAMLAIARWHVPNRCP